MAKIQESTEQLPDGKELTRWHLLDNDYRLIKPVEQFLRYKQNGGSAIGTVKTYAHKLKVFWQYLELKDLDWRDFVAKHMADFGHWYLTGLLLSCDEPIDTASKNAPVGKNGRTVDLACTVVTLFYEFHFVNGNVEDKMLRKPSSYTPQRGLLAGYIKASSTGAKQVKYGKSREFPGCLTPEQEEILINACRTSRDKLILHLLGETGMRVGELLGLHRSDVDWRNSILKVVRRNNPNHAYAKGQERELSISRLFKDQGFCDILTSYLDEEYPEELVDRLGHDMLFVVLHKGSPTYGHPLEPQNLNKLLKRLHKKTGIDLERLYPHLYRHTYATRLIRKGRQKGRSSIEMAKIVQRLLGHKSIVTTLDIYYHSFTEADLKVEFEGIK